MNSAASPVTTAPGFKSLFKQAMDLKHEGRFGGSYSRYSESVCSQ